MPLLRGVLMSRHVCCAQGRTSVGVPCPRCLHAAQPAALLAAWLTGRAGRTVIVTSRSQARSGVQRRQRHPTAALGGPHGVLHGWPAGLAAVYAPSPPLSTCYLSTPCAFDTRLQADMPASCWDDQDFRPAQVLSSSPLALEAYSKGIQVRA